MTKRTTIATLAVAGALGLGALGSAALADSPKPTPPSTQPGGTGMTGPNSTGNTGPTQGADVQEPTYTGTITVPQTNTDGTEAQESAALAGLAKITADQANTAALTKFPGATIQKTELEDENGSLVWAVSLTDANKAKQDVKVDAGSGAVLSVQPDESGAEGAAESATETTAESTESGN